MGFQDSMAIPRRFFLKMGAGALLAPIIHSCTRQTEAQETLRASNSLLSIVKERGYFSIATEDFYPPFEFLVNGKPVGLDHDLFALLQKYSTFEIRQEILPWKPILPGVGDGQFDAAVTAAIITEERAQYLDFTMPISETTQVYLKRLGDDGIQSVADLSGKTLGVQQGGASFNALPGIETTLNQSGGKLGVIRQYGSFAEAYRDLEAGRVDAVINNIVSLSILVTEKPGIFELGQPIEPRSYAAWPVQKGNQVVLEYLNQFMAEVRANGELKRLQQLWLKRTFDLPDKPLLPGDRPLPTA